MPIPFHRPSITEAEIAEVEDCLRSGWLTTGPRVGRFEGAFAEAVGARHALGLNSCTAALHLAVEALGLRQDKVARGQAVLVPTLTFAATAEVVRYQGAVPILVDCEAATGNMDLDDAAHKLRLLRGGWLPASVPADLDVVGIMLVHVGGHMMDVARVERFAAEHGLWVAEDAAHAFPASWRAGPGEAWRRCGEHTASVTCFSFYANKTITTGEGGMAVTGDPALAERMRMNALHGLSRDAWNRYTGGGSWDYQIVTPGYKYNLTDIAAAIGIHQLARAEAMRAERAAVAEAYWRGLGDCEELELPPEPVDRISSWHLYPIRLRLERLAIDRGRFIECLKERGVATSVHWRPLHLHPYYQKEFGWTEDLLPVASREWPRRISLPIFPGMTEGEVAEVVDTVRNVCREQRVEKRVAARVVAEVAAE